ALTPPILDHALRGIGTSPIVAIKGAGCDVEVELRAVGGERGTETVEYLDRRTARILGSFHHQRRNGADQDRLGDAALRLAVLCNIACDFATTGRMADVHG